MTDLGDLRPLGQIHDSFIIAAGRDGLWIIDQHVAHERILFEQVLKQQAAGRVEVQQLLMPLILQLTPGQQIEYARIADELQHSGFETEPFGNRTIAVKAAPAAVGIGDLERVIYEILEIAENELRSVSLDDLRRGIAASHRLPGGDQDQYAARPAARWNGCCARSRQPNTRWPARTAGRWRCSMACARSCGPFTESEMGRRPLHWVAETISISANDARRPSGRIRIDGAAGSDPSGRRCLWRADLAGDRDATGHEVALGNVYAALDRLEENGLVLSRLGEPTAERGGRARRFVRVTATGLREARAAQRSPIRLWRGIPQLSGETI